MLFIFIIMYQICRKTFGLHCSWNFFLDCATFFAGEYQFPFFVSFHIPTINHVWNIRSNLYSPCFKCQHPTSNIKRIPRPLGIVSMKWLKLFGLVTAGENVLERQKEIRSLDQSRWAKMILDLVHGMRQIPWSRHGFGTLYNQRSVGFTCCSLLHEW